MRRLSFVFVSCLSALATPVLFPSLPGHFVPLGQLSTCPKIQRRPNPTSISDVRPDDFKVVIALGDSITAALFAKGSRNDVEEVSIISLPSSSDPEQRPLIPKTDSKSHNYKGHVNPLSPFLSGFVEDRGVSYAAGGDDGAITIPNIISYYAGNITGSSKGSHPPVTCLSGFCTSHPKGDGLNGAISGSLSTNLLAQVTEYIVPQIQAMGIPEEHWKYVNLGIGANDVCAYCLSPNMTSTRPLTGSPEEFAAGIKTAIDYLRDNVPNIIVNIIGMFRVSDIYALSLKGSSCSGPIIPPTIPHLPIACSCAFIPGPAGDFTRRKMDELGEAYDKAVWEVIDSWHDQEKKNAQAGIETKGFGVTWQPGTVVDLENYPSEALSSIDCFHPSILAHQRMAAGIFSRLTLPLNQRSIPIKWEDEIYVRCLEEEDRIQLWLE